LEKKVFNKSLNKSSRDKVRGIFSSRYQWISLEKACSLRVHEIGPWLYSAFKRPLFLEMIGSLKENNQEIESTLV
jgi:hypothetical protein